MSQTSARRLCGWAVLAAAGLLPLLAPAAPAELRDAVRAKLDAEYSSLDAIYQLRNLVVMNRLMGSLGYGPMKVLPLATRCDAEGLKASIHGLDLEIAHCFPRDDEACDRAVKLGQPVSRIAPKSPLTIALRNALAPIIKVPAPLPSTPPRPSILEMLLGSA